MARAILVGLLAVLLSGCSYLTDYLLKKDDGTGIAIDAQIGDTENKVETGLGKLGLETTNNLTVEDSQHVQVTNETDRYKITAQGDTTVNVYETNKWLYIIFGLYIIGKPALRWAWRWRDSKTKRLHEYEQCSYTTIRPRTSNSREP